MDHRGAEWEEVEAETRSGLRSVWGALAMVAAIGAVVALLYLYLPAVWVAASLVVLALLIGGAVLASGMQRPRQRL